MHAWLHVVTESGMDRSIMHVHLIGFHDQNVMSLHTLKPRLHVPNRFKLNRIEPRLHARA